MRLITLPRTLLIVITLAVTLLPSGVGQAAPAGDTVAFRYYLKINMDDSPLCSGRNYPVTVSVVSEGTVTDPGGTKHVLNLRPVERQGPAAIEGHSYDASIAKISPSRLISGWDVDDPLPNAAHFTLTTGKAGSTSVFFEAVLMGKYVGPVIPVKVVNCKYKVTMTQRGNVNDVIVVTMSGLMTTTISGEAGDMSGSGSFRFALTASVPPVCGGSGAVTPIDTKVTGRVSDSDQLDLTIAYDPNATISESLKCPIGGTFAGSSGHSTSDVLSIQVASLPADGGTKDFPYSCYGGIGSCTLTITAEPLPAE